VGAEAGASRLGSRVGLDAREGWLLCRARAPSFSATWSVESSALIALDVEHLQLAVSILLRCGCVGRRMATKSDFKPALTRQSADRRARPHRDFASELLCKQQSWRFSCAQLRCSCPHNALALSRTSARYEHDTRTCHPIISSRPPAVPSPQESPGTSA
jgi:hypothetical protein